MGLRAAIAAVFSVIPLMSWRVVATRNQKDRNAGLFG
jgi:hypothetical protein